MTGLNREIKKSKSDNKAYSEGWEKIFKYKKCQFDYICNLEDPDHCSRKDFELCELFAKFQEQQEEQARDKKHWDAYDKLKREFESK